MGLLTKTSKINESINKKYQRDGARGLFYSAIVTPLHTVGSPIVYPVVEQFCNDKIIEQNELRHRKLDSIRYEFGSKEFIDIEKPYSVNTIPVELERVCGTRSLKEPFVSVLESASLVGPTAIGVTASSDVILETCISRRDILERDLAKHPYTLVQLYRHNTRSKKYTIGENDFEEVCSLVNLYKGYYHWIQNSLTRLEGLDKYSEKTGNHPQLIIRKNPPSWMRESLELLGYSSDRWIEWDRDFADINRLVIPSMRRRESLRTFRENKRSNDLTYKDTSASAYRWLRDRAVENLNCNRRFPSKILISREDAHGRRIKNKDTIYDLLRPLGFKEFELSELSFQEQVKLFSEADSVISPHGAGLINLVFAQQNCSVIELFPSWIKPTFYLLASNLGHKYGFLSCKQINRDIIVNQDELLKLMRSMDMLE